MASEINIRPPAVILETSRALQAANRRRLELRQGDGWAERRATRTVERGMAFAESQISRAAGRADPWRGAVPEFEPQPMIPAKRFGKRFDVAAAHWRYEPQEGRITISTADRSATATIEVSPVPQQAGQDVGLIWYQCLPAGGGRLVLIFYAKNPSATAQFVGSSSFTSSPGASRAVALAEQYIQELANPELYRVTQTLDDDGEDRRPATSLSLDTLATRYLNVQANVVAKAAVVTLDSVSVIDWPGGYESIARSKFTVLGSWRVERFNVSKGRMLTETASIETSDPSEPDGWRTLELGFFFVETSNLPLPPDVDDGGGKQRYIYVPNIVETEEMIYEPANANNYQQDNDAWLMLLRSYGYGRLLNRSEQDPAWGWTPAVFAFLRSYEGEFHGEMSEEEKAQALSYDHIRQTYLASEGPAYMLDAGYRPEEYEGPQEHWYFQPPAGGSVTNPQGFQVPPIQPRRNKGPSRLVPVDGSGIAQDYEAQRAGEEPPWRLGQEVPVVAWDWGRPLACLLELQALGFTAAALGLSEEEAAALAAADPAVSGFAFSQGSP